MVVEVLQMYCFKCSNVSFNEQVTSAVIGSLPIVRLAVLQQSIWMNWLLLKTRSQEIRVG